MPFTDQGYEPYTEDELYQNLVVRFEDRLGTEVTAGNLVDEILRAEAAVLSEFQEEMISKAYDSAFVELAEGDDLTRKARELGVVRQEAVQATGVARFRSNSPVAETRIIPEGTIVQTGDADPIEFVTTENTSLKYYEGFEAYSTTFDLTDLTPYTVVDQYASSGIDTDALGDGDVGDKFLTFAESANDGAVVDNIFRTDTEISRGTEFGVNIKSGGSKGIFRFGLQDDNNCYEVVVNANPNMFEFQKQVGGSITSLGSSTVSLEKFDWYRINVDWKLNGKIKVSIEDLSGNTIAEINSGDKEYTSGGYGFRTPPRYESFDWDHFTASSVSVNIEPVTGVGGDLASGKITLIKNGLTGIDSVTNKVPIGDDSYFDSNGNRLIPAEGEEKDEQLRRRVFNSLSGGGEATRGAIYTAVSNLDEVVSLDINDNPTSTDNTGSGGLPPYSSEIVVFGGKTDEIVEKLYGTMSFIDFLRLHAGVKGTEKTADVYDETIDSTFTGRISRPPRLSLEVVVDLVYDSSEYAGDEQVKESIVQYIGGTDKNGTTTVGTGVGEDVYKSEVQAGINRVPGVLGTTNVVIDTDGDGSDDTVSNTNGLDVIDVSGNEVAEIDIPAGAVTINKTQK
jgi:uncharacterized phage protein gp47/JayE